MDFGYGSTATTANFREILASAGRGSRVYGLLPLNEVETARMLVIMGNTRNSKLPDSVPGSATAAAASAFGQVMDAFAAAAGRQPIYANGRGNTTSLNSEDWRHEVVAAVLREDHGHLDWSHVIAALDFPDCSLISQATFQFIAAVTLSCNSSVFPTNELLRKSWNNTRAQLDAIRHAISAPPDVINFSYGMVDQSRLLQPVAGGNSTISNNSCWYNVDLYSILLRLAIQGGPDAERTAAAILDQAQNAVPELVLLGMARCKVDDGIDVDPSGHDPSPLRARIYNTILTSAFGSVLAASVRMAPSPLQTNILVRLWDISRPLTATSLLALVRGIANRVMGEHEQFRTSMEGVARVVGMTMNLADFVTVLLSAPAPQLAIEVAVYFAQAGPTVESRVAQEPVPANWQGGLGPDGVGTGLKLDSWLKTFLTTNMPQGPDRFAAACLAFLKRVISSQTQVLGTCRLNAGAPQDGSGSATTTDANGTATPVDPRAAAAEATAQEAALKESVVRPDILIVIFKRLKAHSNTLSAATQAAITNALEACSKLYPNLTNGLNHEIEETATALLQRIYSAQMSVVDFIELLRQYKNSGDSREREIFQRVIHNLFDEYRYFAKYPDKELRITGVLFGMLIQHQLVSNTTSLAIALRYVLDALRKAPTDEPNVKMYKFGVFALEQFKSLLPKWPQYCSQIAAIPHLRAQYPAFVAEIDTVLAQSRMSGANSNSGDPTNPSDDVVAALATGSNPSGDGIMNLGDINANTGSTSNNPVQRGTSPTSVSSSNVSTVNSSGSEIRTKLAALGADLTVALAALAIGQPIPAILPSAAAAAAAAKEAEERAAQVSGNNDGSSSGYSSTGLSSTSSTNPLDARPADPPPAAISDRITFIINNMTETNVETKAVEAAAVVRPEHYTWLANYIVTKRVAAQPNFQPMYRVFLERFGSRELDREVLRTTLEASKRFLSSEKIKTSTQERSSLKNLGAWLGRITLARSRPLLYRDLNVKELLWDAYETGRLFAVVAFLAKILEAAAESPVFHPPNPWTMAMLGALRELYDVTDLKLNLKFEVEVLCKALGVELKDIRPSNALHLRKRPDLRGNPDFKAPCNPESIPGIPPREDATSGMSGLPSSTPAPGGVPSIPGLLSLVTLRSFSIIFHPNAPLPPPNPDGTAAPPEAGEDPGAERDEPGSAKANLRNILAVAVDRAVRELIQPVVDRSVTIAVISARELVTKDFAAEPDADKMAHAAHVLASDLAGSLAVITCQDPLKAQIGSQLRTLLTAHPSVITSLPVSLQQLGDAAVNSMLQGVVTENLEVACLLVEKAAMERAVRAIDEALANAYSLRRKAQQSGTTYVDTSVYTSGSRWPVALPEALRPHAGTGVGLSDRQLRVYESFVRGSTSNNEAGAALTATVGGDVTRRGSNLGSGTGTGGSLGSSNVSAAAMAAFTSASTDTTGPTSNTPVSSVNAPVIGQPLTPGQALSEYGAAFDRLATAIRNTAAQLQSANPGATIAAINASTITSLPSDHDIIMCLREIRTLGLRVPPGDHREQVFMLQAQKLFKGLLELPTPPASILDGIAMQTYLAALVVLRDCCRQLNKDLVKYLPLVPEDRRFVSDAVVLGLLRSGLLSLPEFDAFLRSCMDSGRGGTGLRFAMLILQRSVVVEKSVLPSELPVTIEALLQIANRQQATGGTTPAPITALLEGIKAVAAERARSNTSSGSVVQGPNVVGTLPTLPISTSSNPIPSVTIPAPVTPNGVTQAATAVANAAAQDAYTDEVRSKVLHLLETWVRICAEAASGNATDRHYQQYLSVLQAQGVLANDFSTERFLRVMMDLCVQSCAATAKPYPDDKVVPSNVLGTPNTNVMTARVPTPRKSLTYTGVDALSKLVVLLLKVAEGNTSKINLLQKLMGIFVRALIRDADINGGGCTPELAAGERPSNDARFDQRPYLRLFTNLFRDLHLPMPPPIVGANPGADEAAVTETITFNAQVLATFANVFHLAQPSRVPGFAYAWLELISHRQFLPPLLSVPGQRGWPLVHRLLIDLFRFLYPYLRRGEMNEGLRLFFKGTVRIVLVLLHDYPDFLADYHNTFLDIIPVSCVQLRNLILAAAPRAVRLPDPFDRNLVPETLPACTVLPRILGTPGEALPASVREEIDNYLRTRTGTVPTASIRQALVSDPEEAQLTLNRYSLRVINSLVLYLAHTVLIQGAAAEGSEPPSSRISGERTIALATNSGVTDIFRNLITELDAEGRYILLNALTAQLRYPNAHTLFFTRFLLSIYDNPPSTTVNNTSTNATTMNNNNNEILREQLCRALLERIIVHRPHPWGILITLAELVRNPTYNLSSHSFVHSSPEVEKLFEGVARSCLAGNLPQGWVSTTTSTSGSTNTISSISLPSFGTSSGPSSVYGAPSTSASGTSTPNSVMTGNPGGLD